MSCVIFHAASIQKEIFSMQIVNTALRRGSSNFWTQKIMWLSEQRSVCSFLCLSHLTTNLSHLVWPGKDEEHISIQMNYLFHRRKRRRGGGGRKEDAIAFFWKCFLHCFTASILLLAFNFCIGYWHEMLQLSMGWSTECCIPVKPVWWKMSFVWEIHSGPSGNPLFSLGWNALFTLVCLSISFSGIPLWDWVASIRITWQYTSGPTLRSII